MICLAGAILLLSFVSSLNHKNLNQSLKEVEFELPVSLIGPPARLKIPKINIDTLVEYVGLTSEGAMDTPESPNNVAWFDLGPRPGEIGSATISGHFGWKNGKPSIFDNLHKLQKGDEIYIEDEKGETITFIVTKLQIYDLTENASEVFVSNDGASHLNLITCEGSWDKVKKTYSNRLIVFSDKK